MDTKYPIGICNDMCPEEEIIRRERENRLHILEVYPGNIKFKLQANRNYVVKEFTRSAAGKNVQDVKNLRTQDALLITIGFLLHDVINNETVPWNIVYDFIMDRLRAVRQDMVIQNFPRSFCIGILQPIVKFYVYAAYKLCNEPISNFDPYINKTHLQECLKRLLCMYDDLDILVSKSANSLDQNLLITQPRPFMESLYLILNLGNTTAMERTIQLSSLWKNNLIQKCFKMSLDYWRNNFVSVCRHIQTLPPLLGACAALHLPKMRKQALRTMSTAYNCKNITFPANILQQLLLYNNIEDVIDDCLYYGINVEDDKIIFNKNTFQYNKQERSPTHYALIDEVLNKEDISSLLLEDNFEKY